MKIGMPCRRMNGSGFVFERWISVDEKEFSSDESALRYQRRARRYYDIINLRQPDRVPCIFTAGGFMPRYAGKTYGDFFYDYEKTVAAHRKFYDDFERFYLPPVPPWTMQNFQTSGRS